MTIPVFLVGARRSGTTLFRLMLGGHKDVHFQHRWEDIASAFSALDAGAANIDVEIEEFGRMMATSEPELRQKIETEAAQLLQTNGAMILGATCHIGFLALHKAWPDAKFIHLLRDPRDVAISHRKLGWSGHDYFAGDGWVTAERDCDKLKSKLGAGQYLTTRYEDLVLDPEAELTRLCAFLGIAYTQDLYSYTETSPYSYPKKELANRWKGQLTPERLPIIEARMRPLMRERGYDPSAPATKYSGLQIKLFKVREVLVRRVSRVRKHGFYYVAVNMLARRLPIGILKRHADRLQARRHAKHVSSLEKSY
jgi:hypothetical protein